MLIHLWTNRLRPPFGSRPWMKQWAKRAWTFPDLIRFAVRAASLRWRGATLNEGVLLSPLSVNGDLSKLKIGSGTFIGRVQIQLQAIVEIGSNVCINDGVRIITASHDVANPGWKQFAKPIYIRNHAWIATGAIILPGVTIGEGAVVGAGAVVAKNVPPFAVAAGNPAYIREQRRCSTLRYSPTEFIAFRAAWLGTPPSTGSEAPALSNRRGA